MSDIQQWSEVHDLWKYLIPNTSIKGQNTRPYLDVWHTTIIWSEVEYTKYLIHVYESKRHDPTEMAGVQQYVQGS